jgi:hypothetical protein
MKSARGLWLDDVRPCPFIGHWKIARSYDEAVKLLEEYGFDEIWLDHDLDEQATLGNEPLDKTGFDVLQYCMEAKKLPKSPKVFVHSLSIQGTDKMCKALAEYYKTPPEFHRQSYLKIQKMLLGR